MFFMVFLLLLSQPKTDRHHAVQPRDLPEVQENRIPWSSHGMTAISIPLFTLHVIPANAGIHRAFG